MPTEENSPSEQPSSGWLVEGGSDPEEIAGRYDEWAEQYDVDLESWGYRAPEMVAELLLEHHPAAAAVLDAGCGTGLVGRALRRAGYTGVVDGIDVSADSLRLAEDAGGYRTLRVGDLQERLGVPDDEFDGLVCVGVMTYLPDVEEVWREFTRVVAPGGLIVVTQREDLWGARACEAVIERLTTSATWASVDVVGPEPYLPGNSEGMAPIGVYYVTARVA